jgi:general stress protein 26
MECEFKKLGELIADIDIALVTTVESDGTLHTRPLATLAFEPDGDLWFFISLDSAKLDEPDQDTHVSVAYSHPGKHTYVAVAGTAQVLKSRAKAKQLWMPVARAWFPEGVDDSHLALLRVRVERAEYWTSPGTAAYLLGAAKASFIGRRTSIGENRKLLL